MLLFWERYKCKSLNYANEKQKQKKTYCTVESLRSRGFEELGWLARDDYVIGKSCTSEHGLLGEIVLANHCVFLWVRVYLFTPR